MARCPNCGRETMRTLDWCCQWCGYPLFSGSFKKIDKTYKELREERVPEKPVEEEVRVVEVPEPEPVMEEVVEVEEEPEEEPEEEEVKRPVRKTRRVTKRKKAKEPEPEPVVEEVEEEEEEIEEEEPVEEKKPAPKRRPAARRKRVKEPEPEPVVEEVEEEEEIEEEEEEIEEEEEVEEEPETLRPAMELTVDEVISAYETEGAAADARFVNQILRVTGTVDKIEVREAMDIYSISLAGSDENTLRQRVRCVFNRRHGPELQQLMTGQTVTVQGKYDGSIISISMRDCTLV